MNRHYKKWISAEHRLTDIKWREIYEYRELLFMFVKRDFVAKYKQTVLGPLWAVVQPLFSTVFYTLVFSGLARISTADTPDQLVPAFLFYLASSTCWGYFSSTVYDTSGTFFSYAGIMGKVYFPRLIMPVATALSRLISFGIQMGLYVITALIYHMVFHFSSGLGFHTFLLFPVILQMMMLGTGCGMALSALTTKYRDLQFSLSFFLTLWQYASPVVYGLSLISEGHENLMKFYLLNPMTPILTSFRYALFGNGFFSLRYFLISWGETGLIFFLGLILFNKMEKTFIDTI